MSFRSQREIELMVALRDAEAEIRRHHRDFEAIQELVHSDEVRLRPFGAIIKIRNIVG